MPELRWTLLIIGVLFLVFLWWWERRRPHQASRSSSHHTHVSPKEPRLDESVWTSEPKDEFLAGETKGAFSATEPLALPEIRAERRELPIVELPADAPEEIELAESFIADAANPPPAPDLFPGTVPHVENGARVTAAEERVAEVAAEGRFAEGADKHPADADLAAELEVDEEKAGEEVNEPWALGKPPQSAAVQAPGEPRQIVPPPPINRPRPIVDWPPEEARRLVALRLVARPAEKFRGSLVRQALSAEGFVLGDMDIFHKPDADNRAVLSAASLTKPGTFDLQLMDSQRFTGLNLFTVLPGPRPAQKAFDDLLLTARMLNERLEGALQDERGGPLTPTRIQSIRDSLDQP